MTRVRLNHLELRNFKGVRAFRLDLGGADALVRGDNATGKTTLHDAYTWLLFGKDGENRAAFEIKRLDELGKPASGLDHEVIAEFDVDGELVELRRSYAETWTKKRGSSKKELTGHSTSYAIDGVPVKQREYQDRVADLFGPEERLRIVTDPLFFASVLPWASRRSVLLELVGEPDLLELAELEPELEPLPEILGKRSPEEHRKVAEARRREINAALAKIPVRIDEASRALEGVDEIVPDLDRVIAEVEKEVAELEAIDRAGRGADARDEIVRRRDAKKREIATLEREAAESARRRRDEIDREIARETDHLGRIRKAIANPPSEKARAAVERHEKRLETFRDLYAKTRVEPTVVDVATDCPCCGRPLPKDALELAIREAQAQKTANRAERLRGILGNAKEEQAALETASAELDVALEREAALAKDETETVERIANASARREEIQDEQPAGIPDLFAELKAIELELSSAEKPEKAPEADPRATAARERLEALRVRAGKQSEALRATARIEDLRGEERTLSTEIEEVDREIYLLELLTRTRARLLTERLNERFSVVAFRLFSEQVNGALVETCDVTVDGVPWGDLNHGARMNAGIDVLRVLSDSFSVRAPVWLDNAESVTRWLETGTQTIRLEVDETATELAVDLLE